MKYLVTGATGFLGGNLVHGLCARGHTVVAMARSVLRVRENPLVSAVVGDVTEADSLSESFTDCAGVFHCAGKVSRDPNDTEALWRAHVVGTRNVLDAARTAGVRRVVVASTSGTVGISERPNHHAREDDPTPEALIQRFPYYRTKLYAEREALGRNTSDLEVLSVNPSLLLGPGDRQGSSTGDVQLFLDAKIPAVPAGGISFVDARDAAEAMILAMDHGTPGRRYLAGAANLTMRDFLGKLSRVSGVPSPVLPMPSSRALVALGARWITHAADFVGVTPLVDPVSAEMAQLYWYVDSTRAETELGWTPRDPMETLADTVRDLRDGASARLRS